jgi:hypothetical protein
VQNFWVIGNWEEIVVYYKCVTFEMNNNFWNIWFLVLIYFINTYRCMLLMW